MTASSKAERMQDNMNTYNPYEALRKDALRLAALNAARGAVGEVAWYEKMAKIHAAASEDWMQRRKAEILKARKLAEQVRQLASIPVAKLAPPITVVPVKVQPKPQTHSFLGKPKKVRTK